MTPLEVIAGAERETVTAYRVVASRGEKTRHLGMADPDNVDRFVAAEQRAMRGWRVEAHEETFARWISGGPEASAGNGPAEMEER